MPVDTSIFPLTHATKLYFGKLKILKKPAKPLLTTSAARKGSTQNQTKRTTHLLKVQICRAIVAVVDVDDAAELPTRREMMKLSQQQ